MTGRMYAALHCLDQPAVPGIATKLFGAVTMPEDLPIKSFKSRAELRSWLEKHHDTHRGLWVRIYKAASGKPSVGFEDVLDEGLCFGWSESMRRTGDSESYLQKFAPRRTKGTASPRNKVHAEKLIAEGLMTDAGLAALEMT